MIDNPRYVSGQGRVSELPPELRTWNWGAFFLNWVWGIGNSTYIALLALFPPLFPLMAIILGAYGNKWAWQNRVWRDVDHFRSTQQTWALIGAALWVMFLTLFVGLFMMGMALLKGEAYNKSLEVIEANQTVIQMIGQPIQPGTFVGGEISLNGAEGKANINYSITGPKGTGNVYVKAVRQYGIWTLTEIVFVKGEEKIKIK